ncbi:MAG: hypothetical protein GY711_15715 [bacterium]|nr:hypothetical protein [bacterium]
MTSLLLFPAQDVRGLRADERTGELPPIGVDARWVTGRVHDAYTGRGAEGVSVGIYREDYYDPRAAAVPLATTKSAPGGIQSGNAV